MVILRKTLTEYTLCVTNHEITVLQSVREPCFIIF